jgi:hypothetical protein
VQKGRAFRNVDGKIANPFQIVIEFEHGNYESKVDRDGLMQRQKLETFFLNGDLRMVNWFVIRDRTQCQGFIPFLHRLHGER